MSGSYLYLAGGCDDSAHRDSREMWHYDVQDNSWLEMAPMNVERRTRNPNLSQVAKFNPETSVWTEVPPMQILRDLPAVCTLNGKIYAIGGRNYYNLRHKIDGPFLVIENTVECFNPKTNLWTMCAPMQMQRFGHSVGVLDGNIYVVGGRDDSFSRHLTIARYCEEMDTWETVGQEPDGCSDVTGRYHLPLKLRNDRYYDDYVDEDDDDE